MRRVFLQHWSEYVQGFVFSVVVPAVIVGIEGVSLHAVVWSAIFVIPGLALMRPHLVADGDGVAVTHVVGRRRRHRWQDIEDITEHPARKVSGIAIHACVGIVLRDGVGLDAVDDLPWLPTEEPSRWSALAGSRRRHSLAVAGALRACLQAAREAPGAVSP